MRSLLHKISVLFTVISTIIISSCTKTDEIPSSVKSVNYYPVSAGKVWIYHLDSTITTDFGSSLVTRTYLLKDSAGSTFTDNSGRESFIIYRSLTDTLRQTSWRNISTYYVTPTSTSVEVVDDNNLRFIKLITPVKTGNSWPGNSYIDTRTGGSPYQYLDGWNYMYQAVDSSFTTFTGVFDSTATVFQQDVTSPDVPFDPNFFQQRDYSTEVYARNIGLIYKNFLHWVWQPGIGYTDGSYGITLNLVSYK